MEITHRQVLDKKSRDTKLVIILGFLLFFLGTLGFGLVASRNDNASMVLLSLALFGFCTVFWVQLRVWYFNGIPCPVCQGSLGTMAMMGSKGNAIWQLRFPPEYKYCPMCGVSLDKDR